MLGQAALCALSSTPLASGSVGTGCSVYSQSVPHCAVSEVREEAQETQEESKRPGSVGTEVLHSEQLQSSRDCGSRRVKKEGKEALEHRSQGGWNIEGKEVGI